MKLSFDIEGLPCELSVEERQSAQTPPTIYLDLGTARMAQWPAGPRVSAFRTEDNNGWRLVLHAGDDDSFAIFDVADAIGEEEPVVTTVEAP